jgi:hypothetical protein
MKRQFIYFAGLNWCGTTSLFNTLTLTAKCMHGGFYKEELFLTYLFKYRKLIKEIGIDNISLFKEYQELKSYRSHYDQIDVSTPGKYYVEDTGVELEQELIDNRKLYCSILSKFSQDQINKLYSFPPNIQDYIDYHLALHDYMGDEYKYTGDFNNYNASYSKEELSYIRDHLKEHFEIKVILIFRDPIRRLFSYYNACQYTKQSRKDFFIFDQTNYQSATERFVEKIINNKNSSNIMHTSYGDILRRFYDVFGKDKVCYLIMEEFFAECHEKKFLYSTQNNQEVSKLEQFLDVSINHTYPCAFVPDRGIKAPKFYSLPDQSYCDYEVLTPELYQWARNELNDHYEDFKSMHGSLPIGWGHPIDYA